MEGSDPLDTQVVSSRERFRVVLIVASVVSALFAAPALLLGAGAWWLGIIVLAVDAGVFAFFYRLARRYWVGLLFVPPLIYVAINVAVSVVALQLPMFETITRIQ
jgi:hypothetical protein